MLSESSMTTNTPTAITTNAVVDNATEETVFVDHHHRQRKKKRTSPDSLLQVDEKTPVGNSVKTPNYLRYTKLHPIWQVVLRQELEKVIRKNGQKLLDGGYIPYTESPSSSSSSSSSADELNKKESNFVFMPLTSETPSSQLILPHSPKIERSAKNYLYKSLNHVGLSVLRGYNKHCRRSGCKIINQAAVLKQIVTTHGFKKTRTIVGSFRDLPTKSLSTTWKKKDKVQ